MLPTLFFVSLYDGSGDVLCVFTLEVIQMNFVSFHFHSNRHGDMQENGNKKKT